MREGGRERERQSETERQRDRRDKEREEKRKERERGERGKREGAWETDIETERDAKRKSPCYIVFHSLLLTNLKKTVSQKIAKTFFVGKVPF